MQTAQPYKFSIFFLIKHTPYDKVYVFSMLVIFLGFFFEKLIFIMDSVIA